MKTVFSIIIILSVLWGIFTGNNADVTNAVLSQSENAISVFLTIIGSMAFWSGIMNIVLKSKMVDIFAKILSPAISFIFKSLKKSDTAYKLIVMNIVSNMLGLGNASTPLGIEAVKELSKKESKNGYASKNIAKLIILNTASIQIFPVTVAALRYKNGSENPFDILPCVLITSFISVIAGLLSIEIFSKEKSDEK